MRMIRSEVWSSHQSGSAMPALLTSTSSLPYLSIAVCTTRCASDSIATLANTAVTSPPAARISSATPWITDSS